METRQNLYEGMLRWDRFEHDVLLLQKQWDADEWTVTWPNMEGAPYTERWSERRIFASSRPYWLSKGVEFLRPPTALGYGSGRGTRRLSFVRLQPHDQRGMTVVLAGTDKLVNLGAVRHWPEAGTTTTVIIQSAY